MLIGEACKRSGLTKKAVEYYEKNGLIHPRTGENGYRGYSEEDVNTLREIAVLRALNVGVRDIICVLKSESGPAELERCVREAELRARRESKRAKWLGKILEEKRIEPFFDEIMLAIEGGSTIGEKLAAAFPGDLGLYIAWHFGRFLDVRADTPEKRGAYETIVAWLDGLEPLSLPEDVAALLEDQLEILQRAETQMLDAISDVEAFMRDNHETIERYQSFQESDEYKSSPAYRLKTLMTDFQKRSGYSEIFIESMKVLSSDYSDHISRLEAANEKFIAAYPQAGEGGRFANRV